MKLQELYVLAFRVVGVVLAFHGFLYLVAFLPTVLLSGPVSAPDGLAYLLPILLSPVAYGAGAFACFQYAPSWGRRLCPGDEELGLPWPAEAVWGWILAALAVYMILVLGVPSLVASVSRALAVAAHPVGYMSTGEVLRDTMRPAIQIVVGLLILTRGRWMERLKTSLAVATRSPGAGPSEDQSSKDP